MQAKQNTDRDACSGIKEVDTHIRTILEFGCVVL